MRPTVLFAAVATLVLATGVMKAHADAWEHEERMRRLHFDCDRGERRACVEFGILIGENRERHAEWRRSHPEYWWWERR